MGKKVRVLSYQSKEVIDIIKDGKFKQITRI